MFKFRTMKVEENGPTVTQARIDDPPSRDWQIDTFCQHRERRNS